MSYSFGNWIKTRRKALDLTQKQLADLVGCSMSMIFKIESDQRRPSRQIAELIAHHLDIPTNQRAAFLDIARQKKNLTYLEDLSAPPLPEFPPKQKPAYRKLPSSPTPFIGREHETSTIINQLLEPNCRMLTLTGPGGIGKTRLAIEVGKQLESHFSDGVVFVSLVGVGRIETIVPAIADSIGVSFSGSASPLVQICNFLRNKNILLVIDNMEHLIEGRQILGEILLNTQKLKMLLTSREHLNVQWEWLFEIKGLPIPEGFSSGIEKNSAVKLFVQRASQNSHDFSSDHVTLEAIVRICQLVDGSPLAIELAASWVRILSCEVIARQLEQNLDLLETNKPDVPLRHRSIKSVFNNSWDMLTDEDRRLLMKLSVFRGGFIRETAMAVAGASLVGLSSLVTKSLLRYNKELDRYDLHELIRQYAYAKLQASPNEESSTKEKHAEYYANWLEKLESPLKSPNQNQITKQISSESSNWLDAYHWMIQNQRLDLLERLSACLSWYFEVKGYFEDALIVSKIALEHFRSLGAPDALETPQEKSTFANLVSQVGWFEFRKGNVKEGSALYEESMEIAHQYGDPELLFYLYVNWGYISNFTGDFVEAVRLTTESFKYSQQLTPWHSAVASSALGIAIYNLGKLTEAYQTLTDSLETWRTVGDPRGLCYCMLHLSLVTISLDEISKTVSILQESNQIAAANHDWWSYAFGHDMLGVVSLAQGKYEEALDHLEQAKTRMRTIGDRYSLLYILVHLGQTYTALGSDETAMQLFQEAYSEAYQANWVPIILDILISLIEMSKELAVEDKLAIALSVLEHPGITPLIRSRATRLGENYQSSLTQQQILTAQKKGQITHAEAWAEKFFTP
jgi:predicted ATPase/transcriptional regulator with XRE-family HTH domain